MISQIATRLDPNIQSREDDPMRAPLLAATLLAAQGIDITTGSPQALALRVREDYERWCKVIRATGIRGE